MKKLLCSLLLTLTGLLCVVGIASALNPVISLQGRAADTYAVNSTDAAQSINAAVLAGGPGGRAPIAALITCETNPIRFTFGDATPTAAFGHVLAANKSIRIAGGYMVRSFQFISDTAGSAALLHITVEYE